MNQEKTFRPMVFGFSILVPVLVGVISAAFTRNGMIAYGLGTKPMLAPPSWLFVVAWTVLYIMMGMAFYFVVTGNATDELMHRARVLYYVQLGMNFLWSIIFFNLDLYFVSMVWLILLIMVTIYCAVVFWQIEKKAALLLLPYIIWMCFATYLNGASYVLQAYQVSGLIMP